MLRRPMGRGPTVLQQRARQDPNAPRDFDKVISNLGTMPRILCWKCRKLTPFELDRCEHCGSPFAGSTGGVYASDRGSRVPSDVGTCPVCARGFGPSGEASDYVYACPRCGVHVTSDAVRCSCGAWFED